MLLALVALFYALTCTAAQAEPISAAILGALAIEATAGALAVTTFLVTTVAGAAISFGLGALQKAMAPKPKAGDVLSGVETNIQIGGDIARQICCGQVSAMGHLVYHNTWGANNEGYQQVFVISDWISDGLAGVFIDGKRKTLSVSASDTAWTKYVVNEHPGLVTLTFYNGTQTVGDGDLVFAAKPPGKWTTNDKLIGMSYVVVQFLYFKDDPLYENGIPKLQFEVRGAKLYDPRKDSTAGGSGAHRWADLTTWEYTQNPAIIMYNFMLGFYRNGEKLMGMGVPAGRILYDTVFAAANVCDETVSLDVGGSESRYRCATMLSADESVTWGQTLEVLLSTMAGYLYDYSGFYYFQAGAGYTSSATITDAELVVGAQVTYAAKRSRAELINRIHGQFMSAATDYQPASYEPQISSAGVSADGEELGRSLDLMSVPSQWQAERIAQIRLRESRRQATASITLGFHRQNIQAGDWITWNSTRFGNKIWRVQSRQVDPTTRRVILELSEIDSNVFSWTTADDGDQVPINVRLTPAIQMSTVSNFNVVTVILEDSGGNKIPGLRFSWDPFSDPTVDAVIVEYEKVSSVNETSQIQDYSPQDGTFQTTNNIEGGRSYRARATIICTPNRLTTWTAWVTAGTSTAPMFFNLGTALDTPPDNVSVAPTLTTGFATAPDGTAVTFVKATWAAATGALNYEVEIKEAGGNFINFPTANREYIWYGIRSGTTVYVRVRAISKLNTTSLGWSPEGSIVVAADTIPPGPPSGLTVTASFQTIFLTWVNPTDKDLRHVEIWEAASNDRTGATKIAEVSGTTYTRTGLSPGTTKFYWIRAVDYSGNFSTFFPASATGGSSATTASIISADIAAAAIDTTKFANSIQPVTKINNANVSASSGHITGSDTAYNTDDGKLYRWTGTAWIRTVPSTDITGTMTSAQIADLDAAKLTGTIAIARIPTIPTTQISGILPEAQIASLDAAKIATGTLALTRIPTIPSSQVSGSFSDAQISSLAAAKLTGTITSTQIADDSITSAKIAANTIVAGDIAANTITSGQIAANTITSGQIAANTITAGQVAANTLTANEIAANAITSSELAAGAVIAGKIQAGTIVAADIAANTITSGQIAANTITAGQIAANTLTANEIAANAITASELAADSVTANKIAAGEVVAGKLAADAVVAGNIAANAVTSAKIQAGAITAGKIATGSIVAGDIATDTITAAQIAAGAIGASEISARAITADKLAVGSKNVAFNTDYNIGAGGFGGWASESGSASGFSLGTNAPAGFKAGRVTYTGSGYFSSRPMLSDGTLMVGYEVTAANWYEASVCLSMSASSAYIQINWFNSGGSQISTAAGNTVSGSANGGAWQDFPKSGIIAQAPSGAAFARVYILVNGSMTLDFSALVFQGAYSGQTALSPYMTPGITIIGGGNITTGSITTTHMVANTIAGDRIQANTLNADRIQAGTVLANTVTVSGETVETIRARAADPAARINVGSSLIGPGLVLISGSTTLSSWRNGTDATKIEGGSIYANTIDVNKIKIGARGLEIIGLSFTVNRTNGDIQWSEGYINYTNDSGGKTQVYIGASGTGPGASAGGCIYWVRDNNVLFYAASPVGVTGADQIVLALYFGAGALNVIYGGTIIDGDRIRTRTIDASRIQVNSLTATELIQTEALIVNSAMIQNATIGTLKVLGGAISDTYAAEGTTFDAGALQVGPLIGSFESGRSYTVIGGFTDNITGVRTQTPGFTAVARYFDIQVYRYGTWVTITTLLSWDMPIQFSGGVYYLRAPGASIGYVYESAGSDDNLYFRIVNHTGMATGTWITVLESKR